MARLTSLRVMTDDPRRLVEFYETVTGLTAQWSTEDFAELVTSSFILAIAHTRTLARLGAGTVLAGENRSVIIEFLVEDVDQAYERLRALISEFVLEPTTQPWGNRSILFRDPDGNLVNVFAPASAETVQKYAAMRP